jgi:predicted aspartyl protease
MRLLFWVVAISCLSSVAGAQQSNIYEKLAPNSRIAPQTTQNPSPRLSSQAFYYRPGDITGVPYNTMKGCEDARQRAGNVGICIWKSAAAPKEVIPMHRVRRGYTVPVVINDETTLNFVIDSGADLVTIPADIVSELVQAGTLNDTDFIGQGTYQLADGSKFTQKIFRIRSLKVGDEVVENVIAGVIQERGYLLLGQSFLNHFKSWSIDNTSHILLLNK